MKEKVEGPKRCYELTIRIGSDDWEGVAQDLQWLAQHIPDHGPECDSCMGGGSHGHTVTVVHRPEMTHERYFAELETYLDATRPHRKRRPSVEVAP